MIKLPEQSGSSLAAKLAFQGYWPARAARFFEQGKLSAAVGLCRENLQAEPNLLSGRLIYAKALFHAGQLESAEEQFYRSLALDPGNMVALKYLGDIKFAANDGIAALAFYGRVARSDFGWKVLKSDLLSHRPATARTIKLVRGTVTRVGKEQDVNLRPIPFCTETMGDLYLAQGYPRLAQKVFQTLKSHGQSNGLQEKIDQAERKIKERER